MSSCSRKNLVELIREQLGDCKAPYVWSNKHIDLAIDSAVREVVKANKEEFSRTVEIMLKNGTCLQSACPECEGVIEVVGNVNGSCETPDEELTEADKYYDRIYGNTCGSTEEDYSITSFDVLGDGGCEFQVTPEVPSEGVYFINVLCVQYPNLCQEFPESICRHINEVMMMSLSILYMLEDDPLTQEKSQIWFNRYMQLAALEREVDRDIFLRDIIYGIREAK